MYKRIRATTLLTVVAALVCAIPSFATDPVATMPTIAWASSADTIVTSLGTVMTTVIPFAAVLLALKLGFNWFKKLTSKAAS